jgi:cytochrome b
MQNMTSVRVWDIPVRSFHWLLALSILGLFVTGKLGGNWMEWHKKIGFFVLGLIAFRIIWGFIGSHHARFKNFVRGPKAVLSYAKNLFSEKSEKYIGHNPMGGVSVLALLAAVGFQAVSGLFANDDIMLEGPYASMVSKALSDQMTKLHHLNSDLILILIGVHLSAIGFYAVYKQENLIEAMITGEKMVNSEPEKPSIDGQFQAKSPEKPRPVWLSWVVATVVGVVTYVVVNKGVS